MSMALPFSYGDLLPNERGGSLQGGHPLPFGARRNGRAFSSLTARGGGLPIEVSRVDAARDAARHTHRHAETPPDGCGGQRRPPSFPNRPSRGFRPRAPPEARPSPILRGLSRPLWAALRRAAGRSGGAAAAHWARGKRRGRGGLRGAGSRGAGAKCRLNFLSAELPIVV